MKSVKESWCCSQIENEEEEEEEVWQKENQMGTQWAEDEKLENCLERTKDGRKLFAGGSHAKRYLSLWCMKACLKAKN